MNKKAGLAINTIILVVVLAVGIFIGFKFDGNSGELTDLQQENEQLREQVDVLQTDADENKLFEECWYDLVKKYNGAEVSYDYFSVKFKDEKTSEEKQDFAVRYDLTENESFSPPDDWIYLNIPSEANIYGVMCSIQTDAEVDSVDMVVTSLGGNFQGV